jgi:hypothetical protein
LPSSTPIDKPCVIRDKWKYQRNKRWKQIKNTITLYFETIIAQNIKIPEHLTKSQNSAWPIRIKSKICEISSSHGSEYEVQIYLLRCTALMMEAAHTSETSVDNYFTQQYIPEDKSELQKQNNSLSV